MQTSNYAPFVLNDSVCRNLGMDETQDRVLEHVEIMSSTASIERDGSVKRTYAALMHYFYPKEGRRENFSAYLNDKQYQYFFGGKTPPKDFVLPPAEPKPKGDK